MAGGQRTITTVTGIRFPAAHPVNASLQAYHEERARQEKALEAETGGYAGDKADYFARGGAPLITYKDWLKSNKSSPSDEAAKAAFDPNYTHTPDADAWGTNDEPAW